MNPECAKEKVVLQTDKRWWRPSPLMGQVVLVTTLNPDGTSNVAPKSLVSMVAFAPPLLVLGCNLQHWTGRNILRQGQFVVNVPGAELADSVWKCHKLPHPRPVAAAGLTPIPAVKVQPPRIVECKAHLECVLDRHLAYGEELVMLARIEAVAVDQEARVAEDPYRYLRMFAFLEDGIYGVVEEAVHL